MKRSRLLATVALTGTIGFGVAACGAKPGPPTETPEGASGAAGSTATPNAPPARMATGLDAPSNDPEVVRLAKGVLSCHWKVGHGYSKDCPPGVAWYESERIGDEKSLPTLVSFLEDADPGVRALGAEALRVRGNKYEDDAALSARVFQAAERETDPELFEAFGSLAGAIDLERTGLVDRGLALAKSAPIELRAAQVESLYGPNPYSAKVFSFVKAALHDDDARIREAAISALGGADDAEACELLEGELGAGAEEAFLAARALAYGGNGQCSSSFDAVLGWLEKQPVKLESMARLSEITAWLCADRAASIEQEKRGAKVLRRFVSATDIDPYARASALEDLPKCDADSQAFAASLKTDDEQLKRVAAEIASTPTEATGPAPDTVGPPDPEPPAIDASTILGSLDAVSFLSTWDTMTGEKLRQTFPPGPYRIEGVVIAVSQQSRGRVELSLAGPPGEAVHLHLSASQATPAGKRRRGQPAKAVCEFEGEGGRGYADFNDCHWEG